LFKQLLISVADHGEKECAYFVPTAVKYNPIPTNSYQLAELLNRLKSLASVPLQGSNIKWLMLSKSDERKLVGVQVPSPAPTFPSLP